VKGLFGGHKGVTFSLYAKVEIRPEERALVDKYKVVDWVLASEEFYIRDEKFERNCTVKSLLAGDTHTTRDLADLKSWEEQIKVGCQNLKSALQVMATFGGEEVIEI